MKLSDFQQEDGSYKYEGFDYDDAEDLLSKLLGFCGCGRPEDAFHFVLGGLQIIDEVTQWHKAHPQPWPDNGAEWGTWFAGHQEREKKHFGSSGGAYFFYYWAHDQDLTEHGGSVPGWLTDSGRDVMGMLSEWNALEETEAHLHLDSRQA